MSSLHIKLRATDSTIELSRDLLVNNFTLIAWSYHFDSGTTLTGYRSIEIDLGPIKHAVYNTEDNNHFLTLPLKEGSLHEYNSCHIPLLSDHVTIPKKIAAKVYTRNNAGTLAAMSGLAADDAFDIHLWFEMHMA